MVMPVDYPAPAGLLSAAGDLKMPFPDIVKYCILGISVILLFLSLGILAWQAYRCCAQRHATHTSQDTVNSDLLCSHRKSRTAANNSGASSTRLEDGSTEARSLSHCLSQAWFPPLGSNQADKEEQDDTEKVDGSLRFSIYYDQLQSLLVVVVLQAEGLLNHGQKHNLQPFVKLSLMWASSKRMEVEGCTDEEDEGTATVLWTVLQEWQTRVVKGSCNPLFGDQFSCILREQEELHDIDLKMEVRDFDRFSRHKALGEVRVPLGPLNMSYPLELQEVLHLPKKDLVGEVLLSLKYLPTSQRIEVGLLKVRTVPNESSDAAIYAKISMQYNQCKMRPQKTSAAAQCLVTIFNEVLMFPLPDFPLQECKILVSVYNIHMTKKSTKHLIGRLTVEKEKNSEDIHWTLMMCSIRQPVAKWHALLI